MILPRSWYSRETVTVARELLGKYLIHDSNAGLTVGKIVETEAYLGANDPAAHSFKGLTQRTASLFSQPGTIYVYFIYGVHYCFNVVAGVEGDGEAVLIRALEPIAGIELMKQRRGVDDMTKLTNGPAKLVEAMGIRFDQNGGDITEGELTIADAWENQTAAPLPASKIVATTRVGITQAADLPLRFYLKGNSFVSRR